MPSLSMCRCVTVALSFLLCADRPASAQVQSVGWPDKPAAGQPAKPAVVATPSTSAAPPKPAAPVTLTTSPARPKRASPVAPAPSGAASERVSVVKPNAIPVPSGPVDALASEAPPAPAAPARVAVAVVASEVLEALQQQSEILKRLAADIEAQRVVIKAQQDKIAALELRAGAVSPVATPAPPPPAITVETGGIKLKVSGLFQGWYSAADAGVVDTFRLRRAEIKFSGDVSPRVKWTVMVDPSKTLSLASGGSSISQSGRLMQDAFISLNWKPKFTVEVGEQKIPLGLEGTTSSGKLDVVERALS